MLSKHMYSKCAHFKPVAVELKCKWMKKHSLPRKSAGSGEWCPVVPWRDERDLQLCSLQSLSRDQWAAETSGSGATLHRDHGNTSVPTGQAGAGQAGAH